MERPATRKEAAGPGLGFMGGRLAFPALAAGGLCTADALARFLAALARAHGSDERSENGQGDRRRRFDRESCRYSLISKKKSINLTRSLQCELKK